MKKIICFLLVLSLYLPVKVFAECNDTECENVEVSEYDLSEVSGKVDYVEDNEVLYFRSGLNTGYWWLDVEVNGVYAYCVQPDYLINKINNLMIMDPLDYLTAEDWNRYSLIAFYAEELYNSTNNKNFRYAAQIIIHEEIEPDYGKIRLYDYSTGIKTEFFVENEKKLILAEVEKNYVVPSFSTDLTFKSNDTFILSDENNVLGDFNLINNDKGIANFEIVDNTVVVETIAVGDTSFILESKDHFTSDSILYWGSPKNQDLITVSEFSKEQILFDVTVEQSYGKFILNKLDSSNNQLISGARFSLEKEIDGEYVKEFDFDMLEEGTYTSEAIEIGKYRITELVSPEGYKINEEPIYFELVSDSEIIELDFYNEKIPVENNIVINEQLPETGVENYVIYPLISMLIFLMFKFIFKYQSSVQL